MIATIEGSVEIVVDHVLKGTTHFSSCLELSGDRLAVGVITITDQRSDYAWPATKENRQGEAAEGWRVREKDRKTQTSSPK